MDNRCDAVRFGSAAADLVERLGRARLREAYGSSFAESREDDEAGIGLRVLLDVGIVEGHEAVAFLDLLAAFDEDLEALPAERDGVDADVQQVLRAVGGLHADRVLRVEDEDDFAVLGRVDRFFRRVDEVAVAHHLACECLVGRFLDRMYLACDRCEERMRASFTGRRFLHDRLLRRGVFLRHVCRRGFFCVLFRRLCSGRRFRLDVGRCFEVRFKIRLDDGDLRAVDDLHARALDDDADGARRLQELLVDERGIRD